jgi:pilus assembly protein CpaD
MPLRTRLTPGPGHVRLLPLMALLVLPLSACSNSPVDRAVALSPIPNDYHLRHPVVLADAPRRLDIFFIGAGGALQYEQQKQLEAFARDYLAGGEGPIQIAVPQGPVDLYAAEKTLGVVRRSLFRYGVKGRITVVNYRIADPAIASPLHLSFVTLQARPTTRCGDWPDDLGSGTTTHTWDNRSYYNLGCASQQTLTAQIANPRDLVQPRAEDPTDVQLRTRAIGLLREGTDPSTQWSNSPNLIGPVGGF